MESVVATDPQDHQASPELMATPDLSDHQDLSDLRDLQDSQDHLEPRVTVE